MFKGEDMNLIRVFNDFAVSECELIDYLRLLSLHIYTLHQKYWHFINFRNCDRTAMAQLMGRMAYESHFDSSNRRSLEGARRSGLYAKAEYIAEHRAEPRSEKSVSWHTAQTSC